MKGLKMDNYVGKKLLLASNYLNKFMADMSEVELPTDFEAMPALSYTNTNGVAVINIHGPILKNTDLLLKYFGYVSAKEIEDALIQASFDLDVKGVLLSFDSPGGSAEYTEELSNLIKGYKKPIGAWVEGGAFSAAYWHAASCDFIYGSPSSEVGSIGVVCSFTDISKRYEMMGAKVNVFSSSENKGAGTPGTSLTDLQKSEIQRGIDFLYAKFKSHVKACRPMVSEDNMKAQTYYTEEAIPLGLMDALTTYEQAIKDVLTLSRFK